MRHRRIARLAGFALTLAGNSATALPLAAHACTHRDLQIFPLPDVLAQLSESTAPLPAVARATTDVPATTADPRRLLVDFAMSLRDIRYRRGGRSPQRGFDCSGFVHYVFAQVLGVDLPGNSAAQYADSEAIARDDLQAGDLVFFRTRGKRISHVGIYLGDGRFIHSPTSGERVRVDQLDERYWARRFAGARRPDALI